MLTARQLLAGYAAGVFPMAAAADDPRLFWFDPPRRGVIPLDGLHVSRSLLRSLRRGGWAAVDAPVGAVVAACAAREETWINAPLRALYLQLAGAGHAVAVAVTRDGAPAGGLFGVVLGGAFFGESMVSQQTDGSKMALLWTVAHLRRCGFRLFDTQYLTPHLARMGGVELPRPAYRTRLAAALAVRADWRARPLPDAAQIVQAMTQRS